MKPRIFTTLLVSCGLLSLSVQDLSAQETNEKCDLSFDQGKLTFQSKNKAFKLKLDNRIYTDLSFYLPTESVDGLTSKPNKDLEEDDGVFRFNNGASVRRARFAIKATIYEKWFAELDMDFAYNEVELKDLYLGYKFNKHLSVKAGHFKEPISMERVTSSRYLSFNERPMPVETFAGGRRLGAAVTAWNNHWWVSGGAFGQQIDIMQKEKNRGSDGYGFTGRVAISPVDKENLTVHLGGYATYRTPDANGTENRVVEFRTFPESRTDRRRFVRAEIANVNHYSTCGVEAAIKYKKLLAYGEYMFTSLSRYSEQDGNRTNLKNAEFNGWYAAASYMILGKQKRYVPEDAEFAPIYQKRKGGCLELAARVSHVNLNDFHEVSNPITGGSAYGYALNLNWYPVPNILLGLNYTFMDNDKYADDKGHITKNNQPLSEAMPNGLDFNILQMRLMLSF